MGTQFITVIRQVGIFIICAQAVLQFKPNESYEKYIKLLVSIMVLIQLFIPVASLLSGDGKLEFDQKMEEYSKALQVSMEEITITNVIAEQHLEEMTMEEVKSRLNELNAGETNGETDALYADQDVNLNTELNLNLNEDPGAELNADPGSEEQSLKIVIEQIEVNAHE